MSNFENAIKPALDHEGEYVNNPNDPGGETKYGISKRSYPNLDIKNLTPADAKMIYLRDWWVKYHYEWFKSDKIATKIFDISINTGAKQSHKILQKAINLCFDDEDLIIDGFLGKKTFDAVNRIYDVERLLRGIAIFQAFYYKNLVQRKPSQRVFINGWLKRATA